jgi:uncharacterized protein
MHKAGVFSGNVNDWLNPDLMLEPGGISIVDLSDMEAPYLRNLVIAQVLRLLQARQDEMYRQGEADQRNARNVAPPVRLNIFIEEGMSSCQQSASNRCQTCSIKLHEMLSRDHGPSP